MFILICMLLIIIGSSYVFAVYIFEVTALYIVLSILIAIGLAIGTLLVSLILFMIMIKVSKRHNFALKFIILRKYVSFFHKLVRIKIEVEGKHNIPKKPYVVYANHKSQLDVIFLYQVYGGVISALSKKEVYSWPFIRHIMKSCGVISIDRQNDKEAAKELVKAIKYTKNGFNYIVFPEGGVKTKETEEMVDLRPGAYKLATKSNATISPAAILNSHTLGKKKWYQKHVIKIIIKEPITPSQYADLNTAEIGNKVMDIVNETIKNANRV